MSYILDALRRADSERERGAIPGLHARPLPFGSSSGLHGRDVKRWVWIGVGVLGAVVCVVAWNWLFAPVSPDPAQLVAAPPAPVATAPAPVAAARAALPSIPSVATAVAAQAPVNAARQTRTERSAPASRPAPERVAPPPARREQAAAPAATGTESPVAAAPAAAAVQSRTLAAPAAAAVQSRTLAAPAPAAPPVPEPSDRVHAIAELPEGIRRELPQLAIGGSMYSENAANRMLIVNGQLLQEGAQLAPDLLLQQIKPRAAVLSYKGYRYEIAY